MFTYTAITLNVHMCVCVYTRSRGKQKVLVWHVYGALRASVRGTVCTHSVCTGLFGNLCTEMCTVQGCGKGP